ncbi:hypothetical protein [Phreatobacter sp. AB_2022a]|uniref:hypothetical protein n=1 Tax=Phreatobacter sp. AB_2022a TaxID=3003134 RepID=UPI00228712EF|nr:hypothetical protein [Phreatobacter sp. AB_2022a]MCZ0735281.1 hypothetical protein [Phreatobacter sp. AB_2022a]
MAWAGLWGRAAALMLLAAPAMADPAADVAAARAWDVLGTWRLDCAGPASARNGSLTYAVRNGRLVHPRDFGDSQDELKVVSARILPSGLFEFVIELPRGRQQRRFTLMKAEDGRVRVIDNVEVGTDNYSIRDGALVATGKPSLWQTRCERDAGS